MPAFHEVQFPTDISKGSSGGPERVTDIVELVSGFEERNATMANSRRTYDAGLGLRNVNDLHDVIEFWEARFGQLFGFRWKDWTDYKSCKTKNQVSALDQLLGYGTGSKADFQLIKNYTSGIYGYVRTIRKPVVATVRLALNGIEITQSASTWLCDHTTGNINFAPAWVPLAGVEVTAGYEFDVPVRFDTGKLTISIDAFNHGSIPSIGIKEIRV
jgi:uncharacterized protein (TIGR02217 family)